MKCLICEQKFDNKRSLASHLQTKHKITSKEYTVKYILNLNEAPKCLVCNEEPRYVSFSFKKYCKKHSSIAESRAGKIGGKNKKTWNKGKTKENNDKLKWYSEIYSGNGNPFYGKKHSNISLAKMKKSSLLSEYEFEERIENRKDDFEIISQYDEYIRRQGQYLKFKCKKCNKINEKTLMAFERGSLCDFCFPVGTSQDELELQKFIESLNIDFISNDRKILEGKELDIYIPEYNIAIEYNGLYWHSVLFKDKKDHINKTIKCQEKGIQLIHIFSDEWKYKQNIVKSMIKHRLGKTEKRVYARKCKVEEMISEHAYNFQNKTHISGVVRSRIHFGLKYNNRLIALLSLKKPIHKKYGNVLEIARYSTHNDIAVIGGFSKLLKKAKEYCIENGFNSILTYADLRFGEGNVYKKNGFEYIGKTGLDYWYTDGDTREHRFKYRAKKPLAEAEVAAQSNMYRIYGCGSNIFTLTC